MIKGCQVPFLDTCFFSKDGKVDCYVKNDSDGCLSFMTDQKKLNPKGVRGMIMEIAKKRCWINREKFWWTHHVMRRSNKDKKIDRNSFVVHKTNSISGPKGLDEKLDAQKEYGEFE